VVDTDAIAHELTGPGGAAIAGVRSLFGDGAIGADGALDRKKVRDLVFADPAARARLEGLLHPMIREESQRRVRAATGPYAVLVVPLLIESGNYRERVRRVAVVDCPEDIQVSRVQARSGLAPEEARRIMAAQVSRQARLVAADDVIDNSGSLVALHQRIHALHQQYLEEARLDAALPRS
jgi:dephospho-CoA kinase